VVAGHGDHSAIGSVGGHAEWVVLALDHERRDAYSVELVEAALAGIAGLAGWVNREGQAENG
jgi:hypothetical protein